MTGLRTYLDHNATTPLRPEARAAVTAALDVVGNGSSVHYEGRRARGLIEEARGEVAALVGARPEMVVFTSSATEANNLAIFGAPVERIVVSAVEHASILEPAQARGCALVTVRTNSAGVIDLDQLESLLADPGPTLVSVMAANNETGVIQPIAEIARLAHDRGALVHVDAVQAAGRLSLSWPVLDLDMMSVSGHKLGGPQGTGALIVRDNLNLRPHMWGGGQEKRRRAGTENVAGIAGFGAAVQAAQRSLARASEPSRLAALRDRFETALVELAPDAVIFGSGTERLSNTSCFAVPGISAELLLVALDLDGIAVSSGSACSSGKVARSHVLAAMGVGDELSSGAIRVSLGWSSTEADIDRLLASLARIVERKRTQYAA
ncbi:cysteine desulfurase family protein [Rhodoligotrophos defluvii]|uniref:cysteine desulfurase family protein n=1 Tax=Rhodoligotrophos defluvii TaxID=2561934 RepID=UPI0010C99998|nr:cysteine desulfurase family protein [Rhodoligotrophos defluvii]